MGKTVTWTRTIRHEGGKFTYKGSIGAGTRNLLDATQGVGGHPVQSVTSYRTGRYTEAILDEIPTSSVSAFGQYKKEYQNRTDQADTGHAFDTTRQSVSILSRDIHVQDSTGIFQYDGPVVPDYRNDSNNRYAYPTTSKLSENDIKFYGSTAIDRSKPTNPVADLSTALAELKKEGLPLLPGIESMRRRTNYARNSGSEFLNVEFGWKPLVSEARDLINAVRRSADIVEQAMKDSGKIIRRGYDFGVQTSWTELVPSTATGAIANPNGIPADRWASMFTHSNVPRTGKLTSSLDVQRRMWFSGAYTAYIPMDDDILSRVRRYRLLCDRLFGVSVTPEVLWELAPWSWFGDWFGSIGSLLSNANAIASDGLVLRYGYLMRETVMNRSLALNLGSVPCHVTYSTTRKERVRASPYGFGLNPGSFSTRQWAILGALGLSRAPGALD